MNLLRSKRFHTALFLALVFLSMLLFFTLWHPIPVMDGDDMVCIIRPRPAIPIPGTWNPSRVLPETLMPLCGALAGLLAGLGCGSFIDCQIFAVAAMLAAFITLYIACFLRLLRRRFKLGELAAFGLAALFLLGHFFVFRSQTEGNLHMFHCYDCCCVFFYTISALLSCTMVLFFLAEEEPRLFGGGLLRAALLTTGLYFALFSNLFGSSVLAAYAAARVLNTVLRKRPLRENLLFGGILLAWLFAALIELLGGRAESLSGNSSHLLANLAPTWDSFAGLLRTCSPLFLLLFTLSVPAGLVLLLLRRGGEERRQFVHCWLTGLFCLACVLPFHLLISAAVTPMYAGRPEASFPVFFLVFLLMLLTAAELLRRFPQLAALLPVVLVVSLSMTNSAGRTYADANPMGLNGRLVAVIENEMEAQIRAAVAAGEETCTVEVLRSDDDWANWPQNDYVGDALAACLYKYGLIERLIPVEAVPSDAYNLRYGVPLP